MVNVTGNLGACSQSHPIPLLPGSIRKARDCYSCRMVVGLARRSRSSKAVRVVGPAVEVRGHREHGVAAQEDAGEADVDALALVAQLRQLLARTRPSSGVVPDSLDLMDLQIHQA